MSLKKIKIQTLKDLPKKHSPNALWRWHVTSPFLLHSPSSLVSHFMFHSGLSPLSLHGLSLLTLPLGFRRQNLDFVFLSKAHSLCVSSLFYTYYFFGFSKLFSSVEYILYYDFNYTLLLRFRPLFPKMLCLGGSQFYSVF